MATIERQREVSPSPDSLLTTAIPTPFPRELLRSTRTQREDIVRPATAPASSTTNSTAEQPIQNVQHEPTREDIVSDSLVVLFDFPVAYVR